jgi:diadenosine tetraphosphate (Ap4A) HIT family hydrolase
MYDTNNIFTKILRGEIPCKKVAEGNYFLSFYDINPKANTHVLVIPTGQYLNAHDFAKNATPEEQVGFWQGIDETIEILKIKENGYRLIMNTGINGRQEVPHMHMHILGGNDIGPMVVKK